MAFPEVNQDHAGKHGTRKLQPADLFRHALPWRFAGPNDGRKFRVVRERLRRVARCLARFDRSGNCHEIFPAVGTIVARLNAAEFNYPEGQRFKWSRRTVLIYLARAKRSGIITTNGLSHYHGTRRRVMHSDRLLSVPLESCTPTMRESCTRSNAFRSRKFHGNAHAETPAAAKTAARCARASSAVELRQPERATQLLNAIYNRYPARNYLWSAQMLAWALRSPNHRISDPLKYVLTCADNFVRAYPEYQQKAILKRFSDELPDVYFDCQRWREPSEQDREKIRFVHRIVEEAARRGVRASELLVARLEAEKPSRPEALRRAQSEADGPQHDAESPDAGCIKSAANRQLPTSGWINTNE